jgi:predicted phage terminase large subunit-like protein
LKALTEWETLLEMHLKRNQKLKSSDQESLERITGTRGIQGQFKAIIKLKNDAESVFLEYLLKRAPESLSHFVEFMTPDEPPAAHHEYICYMYEKAERREILRGCLSMPPGHAKTKFFSRYGPAWYLGRNPHHKYLQGGHSQSFAENEFGKIVREIIDDPRYREVFPGLGLHVRSKAAGNWRLNNGRGGYVAKGVGQGIAGYRGHFGGIDDPFGSREDADSPALRRRAQNWLFADFRTRLLPGSPLWIIATRWNDDDLIGFVEKKNKEGSGGIPWEIINLNGLVETEEEMEKDVLGRDLMEPLWPDYYRTEELLELKANLPSRDWWALYKGQPRNVEGEAVKGAWFKRYTVLPRDQMNTEGTLERGIRRVTVSVDCALKATERSNPTAITVWIEDMHRRHFLAEVVCEKLEYIEMERRINDICFKWKANTCLVENAGNGTTYITNNRGRHSFAVVGIDVKNLSKEFRFDRVLPHIEGGSVYLPQEAPWLDAYEDEILAFPHGSLDDQVDATSQYLNWACGINSTQYGTRRIPGLGSASEGRKALLGTR